MSRNSFRAVAIVVAAEAELEERLVDADETEAVPGRGLRASVPRLILLSLHSHCHCVDMCMDWSVSVNTCVWTCMDMCMGMCMGMCGQCALSERSLCCHCTRHAAVRAQHIRGTPTAVARSDTMRHVR